MATAHKSRVLDMTQGDPFRLVLQFSMPLFCSNLLQQLYNLTDTALAGHLLGSASIELQLTERNVTKTLVFSGDIGNKNQPLLRDPQYFRSAD